MLFTVVYRRLKQTHLNMFVKHRRYLLRCCFIERRNSFAFRGLHLSAVASAKSFQDKENEHAHSVMESIAIYSKTVREHPIQRGFIPYSKSSGPFEEFIKVTSNLTTPDQNIGDKKFTPLVRSMTEKLSMSKDEDLLQILHCLCLWPPTPKTFTPNYKLLWNEIDAECCRRLNAWTLDRKFLMSDYWFHLRLSRISQYNRTLISDLLKNLDSLNDTQVIQLMFLVNLQRQVDIPDFKKLEEKLLRSISSVSIEEIGIMCLGFFKTKSVVTNFNISRSIMEKFLQEIGTVNCATVVAMLKFLKKCINLRMVESYIPLLHACIQHVPRWDVLASVHLALLSSECHVYHPLLLDTVTEKLTNELEGARFKDCMKLLQCLSHFNHPPILNFHEKLFLEMNKLSRQNEISSYPRDLIFSALYLAYLGIYNCDVLGKVLNPDFVMCGISKSPEADHAFADIDYCVDIECREYKGPRLDRDRLKVLDNRRGNFLNSSKNSNILIRLTRELVQTLEEIMSGSEDILVKHILPHMFSPDIVVRLTPHKIPLSEICRNLPKQSILIPPKDESWACFVIGPPYAFAYKSKQITGVTVMKLRQLEKLGYKAIFIPHFNLPMSGELRKEFIKNKLKQFAVNKI